MRISQLGSNNATPTGSQIHKSSDKKVVCVQLNMCYVFMFYIGVNMARCVCSRRLCVRMI